MNEDSAAAARQAILKEMEQLKATLDALPQPGSSSSSSSNHHNDLALLLDAPFPQEEPAAAGMLTTTNAGVPNSIQRQPPPSFTVPSRGWFPISFMFQQQQYALGSDERDALNQHLLANNPHEDSSANQMENGRRLAFAGEGRSMVNYQGDPSGTTLSSFSNMHRPPGPDDTDTTLPPPAPVRTNAHPNHPLLTKWKTLLTACALLFIGVFLGAAMDRLGHAVDSSSDSNNRNHGNSSRTSPAKLRMEHIWNCAHQLSMGRGFDESAHNDQSVVLVSPQQKAVDWFWVGAGAGVAAPANNDTTTCQWNSPFGILYALLVLRGSLGIKDHSWFTDVVIHNVSDVCAWKRITCDGHHHIVSLELNHANLTGSLPMEIVGLASTLTTLKLFSNPQLVGSLPTELGQLEHLEKLHVQSTSLHGMVPTQIGRLTNLDEFHLDRTLLSGVVPNELCQLRHAKLHFLSASCAGDNPLLQCPHPDCCTSCSP